MPTPVTGYTRNEFIAELADITGNNSTKFVQQCERNITAWVMQFYGYADWKWTYKSGVSASPQWRFVTQSGQATYTINTANMNYESDSTYIESVYAQTQGQQRKLIKFELQDLRVGDPGQISQGFPQYWFPSGEKSITLWPTPSSGTGSAGETIFIDGKVIGSEINSNVQIPVPYQRQDLFMQFCLYKCLRRERDPRAVQELAIFEKELAKAVADDSRDEESNLRVKTVNEQLGTGYPNDLNSRLWYTPQNNY